MERFANYIAGEFADAASGGTLDVFEPAAGQVYGKVAGSGEADVRRAVGAARHAFPGWADTPAADKAALLHRIADGVEARLEELARAESVDTGKPITLARSVDIPRAVANLRFFAGSLMHFASESHGMENRGFNYTLRQPLGAVGTISPWNLPLYLFTWKIAPALAAGNTVVAKPSEVTPATATLFCEIANESGLPAGVLNLVHGEGPAAGEALISHSDIKAISFTGSTATGRHIAEVAGPAFRKLSLEMGGKNPTIVFGDYDRDKGFETIVRSAFANQGQICLCGSRILIQEDIYEDFRDAFVKRVKQLEPADPLEPDTTQGALVSEAHMDKVLGCIERARTEGGRILCGGERVRLRGRCAEGWFVQPTVIEGLDAQARSNQEEIFGPVVTLLPFRDEEDAIAQANATEYGLAGSLWTQDLTRAHRMAYRLETGILWVNCWMLRDLRTPFGGVKQSGLGREGGLEALRFFTEPKNVCVDLQ
jgi:aminomuconate-semialdehyde/2-hydroxymuconate-6-semialdehyde dehydrogenase